MLTCGDGLGMFTGRALDAGFYYWSVVPGMILAALGMCMYLPLLSPKTTSKNLF
jgi:hypothetical protein